MSISNDRFDEIMRQYESSRIERELEARDRQDQIYQRIPGLKRLQNEIIAASTDSARRYIAGDDEAYRKLETRIRELSLEKERLLKAHGISPDALEVKYQCPDCKDTGYVDGEKCHCLKQKIINALYDESGIMDTLKRENFSTYRIEAYSRDVREDMRKVYEDALSFVENFGSSYRNLLFLGTVGSGKTFLTNCIAKALLDKGFSVLYFSSFRLFRVISDYAFNRMEGEDETRVYRDIFESDLLIIDDLGTENVNSFVVSQFFLILNERNLRRESTIISSNLALSDLKDNYSERSLSRLLSAYDIYLFQSEDIRLRGL